MATRWWGSDPAERFWLEQSYRDDFGIDLNAPQTDERGRPHHTYALITEVSPADVIFHYSMSTAAIVAWSRVIGRPFADPVVWATTAGLTAARPAPHARAGWRVGLEGPFPLTRFVTLADLRAAEPSITAIRDDLRASTADALYLPFEFSTRRPLRPAQFYLAKLPAAVVDLFPALKDAGDEAKATAVGVVVAAPPLLRASTSGRIGRTYRSRPAPKRSSPTEPWAIDPDVLDRGRRGHWETQEELAAYALSIGARPREPRPDEPQYDVAWTLGGTIYVAEVKSLTQMNQESQLRLGLGQVLRYRHSVAAASGKEVRAVLAVERQPDDAAWADLCTSLGVTLVWRGSMSALAPGSTFASRPGE